MAGLTQSLALHGVARATVINVTEAVFAFGEIAQCFGECKHRFGRANLTPAQSFLV